MARKPEYSEEFERFWRFWPGRWQPETDKSVKVGKYEAWLEWKSLSKDEQVDILTMVESGKVKRAGTQYLPDACRWLHKRRWEDY